MKGEMRRLISDTFSELVKTQDVDKITVTMLIGECHISRQTFYYHFQDMDEVLEWTILEKSKKMLEQSIQAEEPEKALRVFVSFFKRNAVQMRKFMESRKRGRAVRILIDALIQYLRGVIERYKSPEIKIDYDDMEVMLRFFACGMMGILIHYADNPQLSEEKLIEQIRRILTGRLVPGKQDPPQ